MKTLPEKHLMKCSLKNPDTKRKTMTEQNKNTENAHDFYINKWFLDFVGTYGEAMIFYAAKLTWRGLSASYTSWLNYNPTRGVKVKSRFRNVHFPQIKENVITWRDDKLGVSGTWERMVESIQSRIFDSTEGYLDWNCIQPASKVKLKIDDKYSEGTGYAEQLTLTVPAWKIPMDELRWGRFVSDKNNLVWIELMEKEKKKWLWINGTKENGCIIEDESISVPNKNMVLELDKSVVLESEKKILSVVEKLIRRIPGFNKIIPLDFIMADETKWLSNSRLIVNSEIISEGKTIHELVNFKPH